MADDKIFIDGDFNDSYESRVRKSTGKKVKKRGPMVACGYCDGTGQQEVGPGKVPCDSCKGTGQVEWI